MDQKFTDQIKQWLDTPPEERDYEAGALYLLKLSGNQIMYRNLTSNPKAKAEFIDFQIQKYYNFRLQALTHEQVVEMAKKVEVIAKEHDLESSELAQSTTPEEDRRLGKREDHDSLPDEIKAKFIENLSILQRMRELHLKLRSLSLENAPCPDSERYPFLKELISLDKKLHSNWEEYDHYLPDGQAPAENQPKPKKSKK